MRCLIPFGSSFHFGLLALTMASVWNATAWSAPLAPTDLPDLVEKVLPGVVNISSTTVIDYQVYGMEDFLRFWGLPQEHQEKQTSLGSGFIIDPDGFILTNNHVVEHATEVQVTFYDKREFKAKIIGKDQKMDLALLQIRDKEHKVPANLSPVPLGDSDRLRIAESVFAVGNPFGLQHTVTLGIISAKNRTIGQGPFDDFLQTDASINPGNSGGPLFNLKGEVIGINTVIYSRTGQSGGIGFAIPVNVAKTLIPTLKRYGRVPRPWLGILGQRMTPQIAQYYNLATSQGVLITHLIEGGPSENRGLQSGDIITQINGIAIQEPFDVEKNLAKHKPKDFVVIKIYRRQKPLEIKIQLEELPRIEKLPAGIL
ncbi:trypsin-like peptidase domain-containing protein [Bdellovibrionota bacterium FG-1]